jgi:hypothetical protein
MPVPVFPNIRRLLLSHHTMTWLKEILIAIAVIQ